MNLIAQAAVGALLLGQSGSPVAEPTTQAALQVIQELDRLAERPLWPGFDPASYPAAVFTGEQTLLFRHPAPPEGFVRSGKHPGVWIYAGRHPLMRSNSKASIGGVTTATLLLTIEPGRPAREEASILVHESFHIFQDEHYPDWTANEAHRFTYPVGDVTHYRMTIEEDHALGRALQTAESGIAATWAARAMATRTVRATRLAEEHREFESGLEMMEGTAFYVAHLSVGESDSTARLLDILPPERFRWRPYATGGAIAALLDRFDPGWKGKIDRDPRLTMERLLRRFLEGAGVEPAEFSAAEAAGFREQATAAVDKLHAERAAHRRSFSNAASWRLTLLVGEDAGRFKMETFDPINVLNLGDGDVLHGHKLLLTGAAGRIEMDNPGFVRRRFAGLIALTAVESGHPLFGDVVRVSFVGFEGAPSVTREEGKITIFAEGFRIDLTSATVERDAREIIVRVGVDPAVASTPG